MAMFRSSPTTKGGSFHSYVVGGLNHFSFFDILGIIISTEFHIFFGISEGPQVSRESLSSGPTKWHLVKMCKNHGIGWFKVNTIVIKNNHPIVFTSWCFFSRKLCCCCSSHVLIHKWASVDGPFSHDQGPYAKWRVYQMLIHHFFRRIRSGRSTGWCPPVTSWLNNPPLKSYIYHKT